MKKFFKTAVMPIAVFVLAIGAAFATNAMKNTLAVVPGYQKIDSKGLVCEQKDMCDTQGVELCTWFDGSTNHPLYGKTVDPISGQTVCTLQLRRIQKP
ncbi:MULTISPECIES: DUF6520 family protein [unclassified Myroides]|uniref:DUF6520 family protein n=1 Tax=unclassified Myroides TaxID=2642485 RepID=UPI0024C08B76|nr:DUF6520 family protein [Myroides sp. mNGS23_01]WHT39519.1 DUF6520 family protein [Myroides sp. mNGS23_01]